MSSSLKIMGDWVLKTSPLAINSLHSILDFVPESGLEETRAALADAATGSPEVIDRTTSM